LNQVLDLVPPGPRRLPNWAIAVTVLGGMGIMAMVGLMFALSTVLTRREHDLHSPKGEILSVPLAARIGLGIYLLSLVGTVLWEWNRRRRLVAAGAQPQALFGRWGTPILAAAVLVGVGLVLLSIPTRPSRHLPADYPGDAHPVPARPAAEWTALGYLPEDTNLIVGVHFAEALRQPAGQELLTNAPPGIGDVYITHIEEWTGLKLADIDHAVLGLKLDDQPIPQVLLVVRTLRPYDINQIVKSLKAARLSQTGDRTLYSLSLEKLRGLTGYLWCPDERTLLIGLKARDFEHVPRFPRPGLERLPEGIQTFLKERIRTAAPFWLVGHVENWEKTFLAWLLKSWEDWPLLTKVRIFGTWWQCDDGLTLHAAFQCVDGPSARALARFLRTEENGEKKVLRDLGLQPEAQPILRALARTLKVDQTGAWVALQATAGAEVIRRK
jgi:hypothetical protein